jgi:hypothetical protein
VDLPKTYFGPPNAYKTLGWIGREPLFIRITINGQRPEHSIHPGSRPIVLAIEIQKGRPGHRKAELRVYQRFLVLAQIPAKMQSEHHFPKGKLPLLGCLTHSP